MFWKLVINSENSSNKFRESKNSLRAVTGFDYEEIIGSTLIKS